MATNLPVAADVDVLVVGGGPAGIGAALAAASHGTSVLIVEQLNCLGGVAGAGRYGHISITARELTGCMAALFDL
jgi:ribulose 1,5-bisphosphate synthetase/thiazole synthase